MTRAALFVDDELRVLDGLRRSLRGLRRDWDLRFALGGEAALDALDADLAVVVSDMRMPGLDGVDVLTAARQRAPQAARVILSGNSDRLAARRAAFVAHRFVAKPCDGATLEQLLHDLARCVETSSEVASFAAPAPTAGTVDVLDFLLDSGAHLDEVARVVAKDAGFALTVLHVASSAFFGPGTACEQLAAAVHQLGPQGVRDLLAESLVDAPAAETAGAAGAVEVAVPAAAPGPLADTLAGLASRLPHGALLPTLELWGLAPALVDRVGLSLARQDVAA